MKEAWVQVCRSPKVGGGCVEPRITLDDWHRVKNGLQNHGMKFRIKNKTADGYKTKQLHYYRNPFISSWHKNSKKQTTQKLYSCFTQVCCVSLGHGVSKHPCWHLHRHLESFEMSFTVWPPFISNIMQIISKFHYTLSSMWYVKPGGFHDAEWIPSISFALKKTLLGLKTALASSHLSR